MYLFSLSLSPYVSATATACSVHDRRYIIYTFFFFSLRSQKFREYLKHQEWSIHVTHEKSNRENSMEDWGGPRIIAKQMETFTRPQGLVRFLKMMMSTHVEVPNPIHLKVIYINNLLILNLFFFFFTFLFFYFFLFVYLKNKK